MFSWGEILVVVSIGVLVFGSRKLPALGRAMRDSVIGFKKGIEGKIPDDDRPVRDVTPQTTSDDDNAKK
jgi:TatA/E family protein of Tat protein translocase